MANGIVESAAQNSGVNDRRFYGVAPAQVISNFDSSGLGRVQIRLPWLPGIQPWARVAVPMAGPEVGVFFIPQVGDEVLVAFHQGDLREAFVIGSLWNGRDKPPASQPSEATTRRMVKTPLGHTIDLDDATQAITITATTKAGQNYKVSLGPSGIELDAAGNAKVSLDMQGTLTIQAATQIELKAPSIKIEGDNVSIKGTAKATLDGGLACDVKAALVKIN